MMSCDLVHADGDTRPRFRFVGEHVGRLVVYRVPDKYLRDGIPLDELDESKPNVQWFIEGSHEASEPILYGVAPPGTKTALLFLAALELVRRYV